MLVPTGDADALAAALGELLADGPGRDRLAAAASRAVRRYDWSTVAADVLAVYETVVAGVRPVDGPGPNRLGWRRR